MKKEVIIKLNKGILIKIVQELAIIQIDLGISLKKNHKILKAKRNNSAFK